MTITVDRVGALKDLMIELLWPFVFALCSIVKRGKRDTPTHVFGSIFLFYFICYYGSVSYFLSWSNWTEEPKTDSRPIKEDISILSQAVTSCELYLITITFLSVDSKVQKSLPTEALSLFTPMRHFTHGGRPPDIPEILYQLGRFNNRVCTLRAALEAEKPDHKKSNKKYPSYRPDHFSYACCISSFITWSFNRSRA